MILAILHHSHYDSITRTCIKPKSIFLFTANLYIKQFGANELKSILVNNAMIMTPHNIH